MVERKVNDYSQFNFRREIANYYFGKYSCPLKGAVRKPSIGLGTRDLRYDGYNYYPETVPNNKKQRCAAQECKTIGRIQCSKCNVGLCIKCYKSYHTNK